jgi:hypothetical protein
MPYHDAVGGGRGGYDGVSIQWHKIEVGHECHALASIPFWKENPLPIHSSLVKFKFVPSDVLKLNGSQASSADSTPH